MPVMVTAFGQPATETLRAMIAHAKGDDPLAPVTVIVPSNSAGLSMRRVLGASGLVNVRFLVLARVAELLGAPSLAATRTPMTRWARSEAVRATLIGHTGLLHATAEHPATEAALEATFRDLRRAPEGGLENLASKSRRSAEIVGLYNRFRALSAQTYDAEDVALAAASAVAHGSEALTDIGHAILYLPRSLSPAETTLMRELQKRDLLTVILASADDAVADRVLVDLAEQFRVTIPLAKLKDKPIQATRILRAVDGEEEVRSLIRVLLDSVKNGTPLHRVAVLYPSAESYGPLLQEQFRAAGIAINGPPTRTLASSMAGRTLVGLLGLPATDFRRDAVMEWLTSAPIVESWDDPHSGRWVTGPTWDQISRDAGIVKSPWQWQHRLKAWMDDPRQKPSHVHDAARLGRFVLELEQLLTPPPSPTMASMGAWALSLLDRYLGPETAAEGWGQPSEAEAYQAVRKALAAIAATAPLIDPATENECSPLAGKSAADALQLFARSLEAALQPLSGRLGRFGEGVFIGSFRDARGMDFDLAFLVGMVEGVVPAPSREDPLLPDTDRDHAALPPAEFRRSESRGDYLAALASARQRILCFPQSNLGGQAKNLPSRWLLESATALARHTVSSGELERTASSRWLIGIPSFEAAVSSEELQPTSTQEWEMRSIIRAFDPREHFLVREPRFGASFASASVRLPVWARRHDLDVSTLSPWAGGVGPGYRIAADQQFSPTAFESFATCPYRYFLDKVIGVDETVRPDEIIRISGADRGNIIHECLERFFKAVQSEGRTPGPDEPWTDIDRQRLLAIADEECARAYARGITGSELLWRVDRARIRRDLVLFLEEDAHVRAETRATFLEAERRFGSMDRQGADADAPWAPVAIALPGERTIEFRGQVDRVDRADDGTLIVYDYKSGSSSSFAAIDKHGGLDGGKHLQLPIYAQAVRQALGDDLSQVSAHYWFASEREGFKRIGYPVTPEVHAGLAGALGTIVATIEAGLFPQVPGTGSFRRNRPGSFENCKFCDFDRVCGGGDRWRAWDERKQAAGLVEFLALTDPSSSAQVETSEPGD